MADLSRHREYSVRIRSTVLLITAIKVIPQYLFALATLIGVLVEPSLIDKAAYGLVPDAGPSPAPTGAAGAFVVEQFVFRPALLYTFVMPVVLIVFLRLDALIKRRILRWYGARLVVRQPARAFLVVTAFLAASLGLVLLPVLDWATNPTAHDLLAPLTLIGIAVEALGSVSAILL